MRSASLAVAVFLAATLVTSPAAADWDPGPTYLEAEVDGSDVTLTVLLFGKGTYEPGVGDDVSLRRDGVEIINTHDWTTADGTPSTEWDAWEFHHVDAGLQPGCYLYELVEGESTWGSVSAEVGGEVCAGGDSDSDTDGDVDADADADAGETRDSGGCTATIVQVRGLSLGFAMLSAGLLALFRRRSS